MVLQKGGDLLRKKKTPKMKIINTLDILEKGT